MNWSDVGEWLKENASGGAALVGSLLTGNIPGAVAAGISLVGAATGSTDPVKALQMLQADPKLQLELKTLAAEEDASIRNHIRAMEELRLTDEQEAHKQQQETIRSGDNAEDEYVRHTRPMMARQSWYATVGYIFLFETMKAFDVFKTGAILELALLMLGPAGAYLGFRSFDKWKGEKK